MSAEVRWLSCLVSGVAVIALGAGCSKEGLSETEVRAICINLGAGGWQVALSVAQQAGIEDEAQAAAVVRQAVRDTCPGYAYRLPDRPE